MEHLVFGMPVTTVIIVTGAPVLICLLLAAWGVYYQPERYDSVKAKRPAVRGRNK